MEIKFEGPLPVYRHLLPEGHPYRTQAEAKVVDEGVPLVPNRVALILEYTNFRRRRCYSHTPIPCEVCETDIVFGDYYFDGDDSHRAHASCICDCFYNHDIADVTDSSCGCCAKRHEYE